MISRATEKRQGDCSFIYFWDRVCVCCPGCSWTPIVSFPCCWDCRLSIVPGIDPFPLRLWNQAFFFSSVHGTWFPSNSLSSRIWTLSALESSLNHSASFFFFLTVLRFELSILVRCPSAMAILLPSNLLNVFVAKPLAMRFSRHGVNTDSPKRKVATWIDRACALKPSQCSFTFIDLCFAAFTFKFFDE